MYMHRNPINGKLSGLGGFVAAGYTAYSTYSADKVSRPKVRNPRSSKVQCRSSSKAIEA